MIGYSKNCAVISIKWNADNADWPDLPDLIKKNQANQVHPCHLRSILFD